MLLNVQMLRGIAAFLVVFVHLEQLAELAGLPRGWTYFGNSGVDLFFVISGMIMVMTTAGGRQTAASFMRNRITRIVPLYWAVTFLVFGIALVAPALMQSTTADPVELLESLAFIPFQRANGQMHPTVFVGWTLNYEMIFYVVFALGMLLRNRALGLAATGAVLLGVALIGQIFRPSNPILGFYCAPMILEFGAGMALGLILPRLAPSRAWLWPVVALGAAAFAIMIVGGWLWPQVDRAWAFGIPAVAIVACAVLAERAGLAAGQGWVQLLGAASYAVYLTHFFCTQAVVKVAERLAVGPAMAMALFPLAFLLVAIVSVLVHRHVELPLTEVARRCFAPLRTPRQPRVAI